MKSTTSNWYSYSKLTSIRAFSSRMLNILAFTTLKSYFINFNILFYNPPNIKHSIFFTTSLNNNIFILSLCFQITTINYHFFCSQQQPSQLSPSPTFSSLQHQQMIHLMHTCSMHANNLMNLKAPIAQCIHAQCKSK